MAENEEKVEAVKEGAPNKKFDPRAIAAQMMGMGAAPMTPPTPPPAPKIPDIAAMKAAAGPKTMERTLATPKVSAHKGPGMLTENLDVQLDQTTLLRIELVLTKQALAQKDQELAVMALKEARAKEMAAKREEQAIRAQISNMVGREVLGNVQLVDKERGVCRFLTASVPTDKPVEVESDEEKR